MWSDQERSCISTSMQLGPALPEGQSLSSDPRVRGTLPGTQGFSGSPQPYKEYRVGTLAIFLGRLCSIKTTEFRSKFDLAVSYF